MNLIVFICISLLTVSMPQAKQTKPPELSSKMVRQSWKVRKALGSKNFQVLTINKKKNEAMFVAASRDCVAMVHGLITPKYKLEPAHRQLNIPGGEIGNSIWPPRNTGMLDGNDKPVGYSSFVHVIDVMCHSIEAGVSDSFDGSDGETHDDTDGVTIIELDQD